MQVYLILPAAAALLLLYPHLRILVKRISLALRLRRFCRRRKLRFTASHRLWWLAPERGRRCCDFFLETPTSAYAVRLFAVPYRRSTLCLYGSRQYSLERYMLLFGIGATHGITFTFPGKRKSLPECNFYAGAPDTALTRRFVPTVLLSPSPMFMRIDRHMDDDIHHAPVTKPHETVSSAVVDGACYLSFSRLREIIEYELETKQLPPIDM